MPSEEKEMSKGAWKIPLLELPQAARTKLLRKIRQKLRQKILEAKMWQELLQADDLAINGKVIWKEKQPQSRFYTGNRLKK